MASLGLVDNQLDRRASKWRCVSIKDDIDLATVVAAEIGKGVDKRVVRPDKHAALEGESAEDRAVGGGGPEGLISDTWIGGNVLASARQSTVDEVKGCGQSTGGRVDGSGSANEAGVVTNNNLAFARRRKVTSDNLDLEDVRGPLRWLSRCDGLRSACCGIRGRGG